MEKIDKQNAKFDKLHDARINKYCKQIDLLYKKLCEEAARLGCRTGFETKEEGSPFSFSDYPQTKKAADKLFADFAKAVESVISTGSKREWGLSIEKNDAMIDALLQGTPLAKAGLNKFKPRNLHAVRAFEDRYNSGVDLSANVWKQTEQARRQIEETMSYGLAEGTSAAKLARDLKENLKNPDNLFRRIRNAVSDLVPSMPMLKYHPGRGVYRSSYQNAMRLARTETNIAYRKADSDYWQQTDLVLGFRVELSNNHTCKGVKGVFYDICDEFAGEYPKTFVFTGWHPNCRCHAIPITPSAKQMDDYLQRMANGEDVDGYYFDGTVTELPEGFTNWVKSNAQRIEAMRRTNRLPYFLNDNEKILRIKQPSKKEMTAKVKDMVEVLKKSGIAYNEVVRAEKPRTPDQIIKRIKGGDDTEGSCASVAMAYVCNRLGYDALDFRGGASQRYFSNGNALRYIITRFGGDTYRKGNSVRSAEFALSRVEQGKEYLFVASHHASIVRRNANGRIEYLELQSHFGYGWRTFKKDAEKTLLERFMCKNLETLPSSIIDIEKFANDSSFVEIMGYINTEKSHQKKSIFSGIK